MSMAAALVSGVTSRSIEPVRLAGGSVASGVLAHDMVDRTCTILSQCAGLGLCAWPA